jgi:hypothetical protein
MKKAVLFLFVFAGGFLFFKFFPFSTASNTEDLTGLNKKLTNQLNDSLFSHEKLYKEELMRMAIQLNQEPFLNMNQRYSRKILTTKQNPDIKKTEIVTNNLVNQQPTVEIDKLTYTIERIEYSSGSFQQLKIYATVDSNLIGSLKNLCIQIREHYSEYYSLVICLYVNTKTGIALAKGEINRFSEQEIQDAWLVFYSYHPVEGDYFDNEPGRYLKN